MSRQQEFLHTQSQLRDLRLQEAAKVLEGNRAKLNIILKAATYKKGRNEIAQNIPFKRSYALKKSPQHQSFNGTLDHKLEDVGMITEYLDGKSQSKSFMGNNTTDGIGFKPKRPVTGRKPNPIEQMQRFIKNSQQLKISKIKKEILERQKFTPEYTYNSMSKIVKISQCAYLLCFILTSIQIIQNLNHDTFLIMSIQKQNERDQGGAGKETEDNTYSTPHSIYNQTSSNKKRKRIQSAAKSSIRMNQDILRDFQSQIASHEVIASDRNEYPQLRPSVIINNQLASLMFKIKQWHIFKQYAQLRQRQPYVSIFICLFKQQQFNHLREIFFCSCNTKKIYL